MRDSAGALNAAIRKGDETAATAAMEKLAKSCDDCHVVFHQAALEQTKKEQE
jgi:cytochrome c556